MKVQEPSYPRRFRTYLSPYGANIIHKQNPYMIAWWSAAFPGFGHILLQQNIRGVILTLMEVFLNYNAKINLAMVYSFTGHFQAAKAAVNPKWAIIYLVLYTFTIFNSFHSASTLNLVSVLAKREHYQTRPLSMNTFEVYALDKLNPITALTWSMFMPGAGQLYIQRYLLGFFAFFWWGCYAYISNFYLSITYIFLGDLTLAKEVLDIQWLLFMPSVYAGAAFHCYQSCVEVNKAFKDEQRFHLENTYKAATLKLPRLR